MTSAENPCSAIIPVGVRPSSNCGAVTIPAPKPARRVRSSLPSSAS
ncbi:hypothetical protein [Actinomadura madurae]|nr:hypothetical protein [Actinomadura madurae]MCP9952450.1 hypothetical protein [Actinomadura madurae]MCQ0006807.1 hypothetical protein [Actinomadura madurae]